MKASVCIATYNGSRFLAEQLASVVSQLRDGDEVLLADDGSEDGTVSIASGFGSRVRIVSTVRVGGVVANFERLLAAATGELIVLCDQDDVWLSGRMDLIRERIGSADLVVTNGQVVDELLVPHGETVFGLLGVQGGFVRNLVRNRFVGCCMAFRRSLRERVLPFPSRVPWHDWYIGLVASLVGTIEFVERPTILYRRHSSNASETGGKSANSLWKMALMRLWVLRAVLVAVMRRRPNG